MSKIYGDFESAADLNECARNLLGNGENDDLKALAEENGIDGETLRKFIDGEAQDLMPPDARSAEKNADAKTEEGEDTHIPDESAAGKLQREIKDAKNKNVPTVPIAGRLTALCGTDAALSAQILLPHKSLEKCFKYVEEQVRKKVGGRGWVDDEEVYQMAVDYYNMDDAEAERIKEEEKKKREEESKKRAEELKKADAERNVAAQAAKDEEAGQISMF